MTDLFLDFETFCDLDINAVGLYKYIHHKSFSMICLGYAVDDYEPSLITAYDNDNEIVQYLFDPSVRLLAYNAEFELNVIKKVWPGIPIKSDRFLDIQALGCSFGYPAHLAGFCLAIGSPIHKLKEGKALIKLLCCRHEPSAFNPSGRWTPEEKPEKFKELYEYCKQDVTSMRAAYKLLPSQDLPPLEQLVWRHTLMQNERGVEIDLEAVEAIREVLTLHNVGLSKELATLTDGEVTTGKQVARMKSFLKTQGVNVASLDKSMVSSLLEKRDTLPPVAVRLLELRQLLGGSSTAKFEKMLNMANPTRVQGNLKYYGGHTGRFAGKGLQIHNLPRATLEDPEKAIEMFRSRDLNGLIQEYENVNYAASALIRSCVIPAPGNKLVVVDYSSIENRVLHWLANDQQTLSDFYAGVDQYKRYASRRFGVPYDDVTDKMRTYSKPCVLGLGFGGASAALIKIAKEYGLELTPRMAQKDVDFYRYKQYPRIPKLWYKVFKVAKQSVATQEPRLLKTGTTTLEFRSAHGYMFILLPSGRRLSYPKVGLDKSWTIKVKGRLVPMFADLSYMGVKNKAWLRLALHPGLLVENIVQALARDILVYGALCAEQEGYAVCGTVHDEIISEVLDDDTSSYEKLGCQACQSRSWSKSIPLDFSGYEGYRYKKD